MPDSNSIQRSWWKEATIYQIYPRSFNDTTGNGVGDLRGIIEKLDYLQKLGVDILWLSPIFDSPNDDNGYDIRDYRRIMEEFGTLEDFRELLEEVHARGMRLLLDLVVNHSSDEHHWFRESRKSKDNPYRDYYYWKPEPPNNWKAFFGGTTWEHDPATDEYYLHLFSKKQPDLNWENPKVRAEVYELMRFWLDLGIDGFRMDVIPFISKRLDWPDADFSNFAKVMEEVYANGPRVHEFLHEMNREVLQHYDCTSVAEAAGVPPELANLYVGADRQELDMLFHFGHMTIDWGPNGRFEPQPFSFTRFKKIFSTWDKATGPDGWINIYLDNHDYARMVSRWADDGRYREESAKLLATLLLTMRGTPCLYQGSELGMTNIRLDDIRDHRDLETLNMYEEWVAAGKDPEEFLRNANQTGRDNARTPMQWDDSPHGGFTTGEPWLQVNPNYKTVNAKAELADEEGIFHYYRHLLQLRKQHPVLIYGSYEDLLPDHEQLFVYRRALEGVSVTILLNFSSMEIRVPEEIEMGDRRLTGNYPAGDRKTLRAWEAVVWW